MAREDRERYPKVVDIISKNTKVSATITTPNDIRIDGIINGDVTTAQRLVIGPSAVIKGDVSAAEVDCYGKIEGNLTVKGLLELKEHASIHGSIKTGLLVVEQGAIIRGECTMENREE
jgi:cytoskeletal protein CcmA (bactofilin family)